MNNQESNPQKKLSLFIEFTKFAFVFAIIVVLALLAIHFAAAAVE